MLTEVDTRQLGTEEVSLFMDTDAQVYLVCVTGYAPITCLTRERALLAYRHPYVYMPVQGSVSASNATRSSVASRTSQYTSESLSDHTTRVLIEVKRLLERMDDADFCWTSNMVCDIMQAMAERRDMPKPYNHETDGPDVQF